MCSLARLYGGRASYSSSEVSSDETRRETQEFQPFYIYFSALFFSFSIPHHIYHPDAEGNRVLLGISGTRKYQGFTKNSVCFFLRLWVIAVNYAFLDKLQLLLSNNSCMCTTQDSLKRINGKITYRTYFPTAWHVSCDLLKKIDHFAEMVLKDFQKLVV